FDFLVNTLERGVGVVSLLQKDNPFDDVAVVDESPVLVVDGLFATGLVRMVHAWIGCAEGGSRLGRRSSIGAAGFTDLAQTYLGALDYGGNVLDAQSSSGLRLKDGILDVFDVSVESDLANIDLLLALLDKASAVIGIVRG